MATAREAFQALLTRHMAPPLKSKGFQRSGNAFFLEVERNRAVIAFHRREESTSAQYVFLVTLGVVFRNIYWFEKGSLRVPANPTEFHIWEHLGEMLPERAMWGWFIETIDEAAPLAEGILRSLEEHGIPWLYRHVSDQSLIDIWTGWLDSEPEWRGDIRPLYRLSVLAAANQDEALKNRAIAALRQTCEGEPCARSVEDHIEKLSHWHW